MMLVDQYNVIILGPNTIVLGMDDDSVLELVTQIYLDRKAATRQLVAGVVNKDWQELDSLAPLCGKVGSLTARRVLLAIADEVRGATRRRRAG